MNTFPFKLVHCNDVSLYLLLLIILFAHTLFLPATAQLPNTLSSPPPNRVSRLKFDKSMAIVLVVLVFVFFVLGFLSVYTRQCTERRRIRGRFDLTIPIPGSHRRQRGLDRQIIETFPTFVYSTVKTLKIGMATLECAVCLNEFQDDETLRLIPKCSHVFHPECIDAWLVNHSTCPVCRANLVPKPGDPAFVSIQIPDPERSNTDDPAQNNDDNNYNSNTPPRLGAASDGSTSSSPKVNYSVTPNRPVRSRSTGFRIVNWFPRSHSTGHSLVQAGDDYERFTLRLPEEVRNRLVSSMVSPIFTREGSGRSGYRTRSVGSSAPVGMERRGFTWTPPFMNRVGSSQSKKGSLVDSNKGIIDDVGERSSDRLFAGNQD